MKKNIIIIISTIIVILVMGLFLLLMKTDETTKYSVDEIKYKEEYEVLNGTDYGETILKTLTIESDNNVIYVNDNEILNLLTKGTNVIYFGWPECNWCRSMLPTLVSTLKKNNIENLYYYNFKSLRTMYEDGTN